MANLNELLLQNNDINNSVGVQLAHCLKNNTKIKKIWLQNNKMDKSAEKVIRSELGTALERLEL